MHERSSLSANGAGYADPVPAAFVRTWRDGGRDAACVHAAGAIDIATETRLQQALRQAELRARLVVLDLRELTSIDASGVEMIAHASAHARRAGGRLVVVRGPAEVDSVFVATGASDIVEIIDLDPTEPVIQALLKSRSGEMV